MACWYGCPYTKVSRHSQSEENGTYLEHFRERCVLFEPAAQQLKN
jgi:hypothetical protein